MIKVTEIFADDQCLWTEFRKGDSTAYTSLINKYSNILFCYGIRFIQNKDFVKDCIQDVFFELWNRRRNINPTASVKSYLFKSLRLRIFREKSKWTTTQSLEEDYCFQIEFNVESQLIEDQTTEEIRSRISLTLNKLPKRQKEILYLRFYEGFNHEKISHVMGLSKQSAYNLLHESIIHLKEAWFQQLAFFILFLWFR